MADTKLKTVAALLAAGSLFLGGCDLGDDARGGDD